MLYAVAYGRAMDARHRQKDLTVTYFNKEKEQFHGAKAQKVFCIEDA